MAAGSVTIATAMTLNSARLPALLVTLLALAGASVASAAGGVKDGSYSGTVGPGYPLSFKVVAHGTKVEDLVLGLDVDCNGAPAEPAPLYHFGTLAIKGDKLTGSTSDESDGSGDDLHVSATFSGAHLTGKVTVEQSIKSLGSCTEADTLTAKLK